MERIPWLNGRAIEIRHRFLNSDLGGIEINSAGDDAWVISLTPRGHPNFCRTGRIRNNVIGHNEIGIEA